jgi:F-type H+-transporting ATPase subunit gamma
VQAAQPYARQITRVISALASQTATIDHPLLQEQTDETRVAVLVVTSDRGWRRLQRQRAQDGLAASRR